MPIAVLVAVVALGCAGADAGASGTENSIHGDLFYSGALSSFSGSDKCIGQNGTPYVLLQSGTEVLVKDGAGATVGVGSLTEAPDSGTTGTQFNAMCHFTFTVPDVEKADFYVVSVGTKPGPTYSYEDMVELGWTVTLE